MFLFSVHRLDTWITVGITVAHPMSEKALRNPSSQNLGAIISDLTSSSTLVLVLASTQSDYSMHAITMIIDAR